MASDFDSGLMERSHGLDIDHVLLLLQVEQEQIQKRTFTNWVNAQLAKRIPPCRIVDLFEDFRDGSRLLDLLEVMSGQRISREKGKGTFQHRTNIEKCLAFLKKKSIKLVNINIPDIIDGKPCIILGLVWTIILQYHIEELASSLSFSSRQSSMESLASLDSSLSGRSAGASPVPPGPAALHPPLHSTFRVSAKKALLLWVREQCNKVGCTVSVKDFKSSWRSGVVFLAVLSALRPGAVDLSWAQERSNRQNLEEAFRVAERELRIPRLLEPDDIDVRDPDEKSIMTYVSQFLQYSRDLPTTEEEQMVPPKSPSPVHLPIHYTPAISASPLRQANPEKKAQEVTCWLNQAYDELLEGWDSTEGECYAERYHVIQTFLVSFNEQRRPIMPLLTAMRRTPKLSDEQRALRQAWDAVTEKLREYRIELDMSLPPPLNAVAEWLLRAEAALAEDDRDPRDHERAAEEAREKQEILRVSLEEMPQQMKTFQAFQNQDEYGNLLVPIDKMDELKRRFTSVRVTAKYHGIKLEYREHRHGALDLLTQIRTKLRLWRRPYVSSEGVRLLLQEWHELVERQELPSLLEAALYKVKQVSEKYSSKSALASDYNQVMQQVMRMEDESGQVQEELKSVKGIMGRVLSAWDSYSDCLSSLQAWLLQGAGAHGHEQRTQVPSESIAEWGARQARLNEVGTFLIESTDPQTSRVLTEELRKVNLQWADFIKTNTFAGSAEPGPVVQPRPQDLQALIREATLVLKEPLETLAAPLRTYRKRLQFIMTKIKEVDLNSLSPTPECPAEQLHKLRLAVPEVLQTLCEAEQVCTELQHGVSGLDTRLAEVLHWETEARDLYKLLKNQERPARGQDPRARILISRGLQLEGQVVTEEQHLQLMVMTHQKNSPLQFLHASALQDRVKAVVQISQEAVGMLSSLGLRRERSPSYGPPPPKVFIQSKNDSEDDSQSETRIMTQTTPTQEMFTPKIVVEDVSMEKKTSPPVPFSFVQSATGTKSPMDVTIDFQTEMVTQFSGQEQRMAIEPQLEEMEAQELPTKTKQFQEVVQPSPAAQVDPRRKEITEMRQVQDFARDENVHEKGLVEQVAVKKTMTAQELKARKAQAMRNRPWLQKTLSDGKKSQVPSQDLQPEQVKTDVETDGEMKRQQAMQEKMPKEHQKPPHPVRPTQNVSQPEPQLQAPVQSQNVQGQIKQSSVSQVGHIETQVHPLPHSPQMVMQGAEVQGIWGQASPSSPVRSPSPQHVQLRSHSQTWGPVRPPSPKMLTQNQPRIQGASPERCAMPSQPPAMPQQAQIRALSPDRSTVPGRVVQDPQMYPQNVQSRPVMQPQMPSHPQPMPQARVQTMGPPIRGTSPDRGPMQGRMVQDTQVLSQVPQNLTMGQPPQQFGPQQLPSQPIQPQQPVQQPIQQPMVQSSQMQGWMPFRGQSRGPVPPAQAKPPFPSAYPQQWTQDQPAMQPPRPPIPQQFPQPTPQMQNYQQWGGQQGYNMGYNQQWGQEPMRPASPMPYGFNVQPSQQSWVQQPAMQGPPPPYSQSQQYPLYHAPLPPLPPMYQQQQQQASPGKQNVPQYQQPPQVHVQAGAKVRSELMVQAAKSEPTQPRLFEPPQRVDTRPTQAAQGSSQAPVRVESPKEVVQPVIKAPTKPDFLPKVEMESPMRADEKAAPKSESVSQVKGEREAAPPAVHIKTDSQQKPTYQVKPHTITLTPTKPEPTTQLRPQIQPEIPTSPPAETSVPSFPTPPAQAKPQTSQTLVNIISRHDVDSPESCDLPPVLAQAPPQAYTEAYLKAQALARNGFEEAKHCLQEHIMEAINVFEDKHVSTEQVTAKEEMLRTLEPELLEEFLRAAKGMEAFCTPAQLRDMELFTQSVRAQWELCFSAEGSFAQAGSHLSALKSLCETLSPEDAHRLAQTQLRECETRLAAIQRQYSGEHEASLQETRIPAAFSEDVTSTKDLPKPSEKPQPSPEVSLKAAPVEKREVEKQVSVEEEASKKEAPEKYENSKRLLQNQLAKIEQSFKDVPSDSVSLTGLHTRLQEIQFLRQETEALWSDFVSQSALLPPSPGVEQERAELQEQWRQQQQSLQSRGSSLGAALRQIDSTENHMVDFTDRLDRFLRQPKDISGFTLANTNILKDIKDLDGNIQSELEQLSRLDPESSGLDPRDSFPLSREVEAHGASLDQLRQQVQKSEAAARALDRFLMSLRTVDEDITGVQSALFTDPTDGRSKLSVIRQSIDSLKDKSPQLDLLLQGARLTVTQDGVPASCLDMVSALLRKLEEVDASLSGQQRRSQKENQSKSAGLRKRALLSELRKLQDTVEAQGLREPTLPALQQRLRALSDLDSQLQTLLPELQSLTELHDSQGALGEALLDEVQQQWDDTRRALASRRQLCGGLTDSLKKFQSCRGILSSTLQRAEQTIGEQASYMGKDNLHKSITKVGEIKQELAGLSVPMEELKATCRQIQTGLKKIPDCSQTSFESEADSLMDAWLDVTEKTDAYMDNLQVALELWDKQLMLGSEVDSWAGAKLALFAASHPFHNEQQVFAMRDEINKNEENIEHFHRKSVEIQEMLQSRESPLELQVMETGLRKRMEQVKELFADCTDVFEELMAVKKHLTEKIEESQSAVENLQSQITKCDATKPDAETRIQDLCEDLDSQELQAESVLKEVSLVSSVASPQALEALSVDCTRLREALSRTREMIHLKREERDKGLLKVLQDEKQSFEEWFQDQQLSVNECFENPESTANVETTIQRLTGFLKSTDPERRLDQLRDQVNRGQKQIPDQNLVEISDFLREQQEEVDTFRTHCQNRLLQMEELLGLLHSLQKQHNSFSEWLQMKEKQALDPERLRNLLKELQDANARVSALSDLLASVRRRGVRGDGLLKDSDNLLQRFENLETQVQDQVQIQDQTQENLNQFKSKAEETRKWIKELLEPISFGQTEGEPEEVKRKTETILKSKPEGDSKLEDLRLQSRTLLDQDLDQNQRLSVQQCIRDTEESWRSALDRTEDALKTAESRAQTRARTRAQLDRDLGEFRDQTDSVQTWISEQEDQLQSLRLLPVTERVQVAQSCVNSKPKGDSLVQDLKRLCQNLSQNQALDDSHRRSAEDAVKETEEQWSGVSRAAEKALNVAQGEAAVQRDYEAFGDQWEKLQAWIREQKQKIASITALGTFEERLQLAQSVLNSKPEGDSKLRDLSRQAQSLVQSRDLDLPLRAEAERMVPDTEQQWRTVLQAAAQAELRSLSDDFENQSQSTQSWIRERQQLLHSAGGQAPPSHRIETAQAVLSSKPDGDCKVNNLRRRGQTLGDHRDLSDGRRQQLQQTVKDTEEQWRNLLQNAKQVQSTAEEQAREEEESRRKQLKEFDSQKEKTSLFLEDLQQKLASVKEQPTAEDRLHTAQAILSSKAEGDAELQELKRRGQSLRPDMDERTKSDASGAVERADGQWAELLQDVRQILGQSERQCALENLMKEYNRTREKTTAWVQEKRDGVKSAGVNTEQTISTAQMILSSKAEGDSKLSDLRRQTQSLLDRDDVDEDTRHQADRALTEAEYQWRDVLHEAEEMQQRAQDQYTVHREMDAFRAQATGTESWVQDLRRQQEEKGTGATGTQAEIEQRLNTAQTVLGCRLNGDSQMVELKRRAQSLSENPDLDPDQKHEVQKRVRDTEEMWRKVLQMAEQNHSSLQGLLERLASCRQQRSQLSSRLSELQTGTPDLPRVFPWPGLGERRQTADQTRNMIDQTTALAPLLRDTRREAAELAELTQDPSWTSSNWDEMEQCIPDLLKKLTEALSSLEDGILAERQCAQLMEQHEAAQDWLREQVKALGPAPEDKPGLHSAINTLKALMQTVHREQREMLDLDRARDGLLNLCTPGGRDALSLDVGHLHDLCATSEQEVKRHLASCEAGVRELGRQAGQRAEGLKERASALQWELRSLDQALSYSQPQNNVSQLQQHWNSLKNCEKSLEGLRVKLDELLQEVASAPQTEELPTDVTTPVKSLSQQHDSLKSRLSDHQSSCSSNADRCFKDCLQNLQKWNSRDAPESSDSLQESLEEGEKCKLDLQEALSHWQFLSDCLSPLVFGKLDQESSETLAKAAIQKNTFNKKKEELDARPKFKPTVAQMSSEVSLVAPPRKKRSQMTPATSIQSINQPAEEDEKQINVIEPMEVESVACVEDIPQRTEESMIWEKVTTIKEDSGTEMETSLPVEKMTVDTKEEPTTQAASQETPVPLRRRSKMVTTEPEKKQMEIETQIPLPIQQESLETKQISTIILDDSQSFIVPGEMDDVVTEEHVKTRPDISTPEDAVPSKRKPKSPKIPPKQMEMYAKESESPETESSVTTNAVVVPARKKSKTTPPSEIFIEKSKEESVQDIAKLSPTKKQSKKSKSSPEIAPKEVTIGDVREETKPLEKEEVKVNQEQKETMEEPRLVVPRRKTKMAELQQKTSQEMYASSESVNIPEVSEKRKPKSPKASPAIVKKDMPEDTELDIQSMSLIQDLDAGKITQPATEPTTGAEVSTEKSTEEKDTLSPTRRKPKGKPKISPELPKKEVDKTQDEAKTERSPTELDSQAISSIQDLDSQQTTQPVTEAIIEMPSVAADVSTKKSMDENGTLSPTKRKPKGKPKISPELPKKEVEETKDESNTETSPTEVTALESGGLSPPKRKPKKSKISPELSKKEVEETKIQAPSVVETTASVSPPKRKSKGKKTKSQDSSEESPMDVPTDTLDEFNKLATVVLEMPGTAPQIILKETIFKPKQDIPTEEVVELSETPSKEANMAQKGEVQTAIESMRPVFTEATLEFVSSGEKEEKKVATILLEMPESEDQPQVSTKPDTIQSMDATDNVDTELAKVAKDLREVPEDVLMQQQETKMPTEDDTATNIVTFSKPVVCMDVSLPIEETEKKKVAILVLEMPEELPITETKSVDKVSEDQPIKEQITKPMEDLAVEPKQIGIQLMKAVPKDISVCKTVKDQIDALAKIEESKVATIILEMSDSAVPKTVPEDTKPRQDQKDESTAKCKTLTTIESEQNYLETKPEQAPRDGELMDISTTPDVIDKEDIKITPLSKKSTGEAVPVQDKDTITMPVSEEIDLPATQEEPLIQEAEIQTFVQETGPDVEDTKVADAKTIQQKFDSFDEVDLQPKSTIDAADSVGNEDKPGLVSDEKQDHKDVMEQVSKPEQVTQMASEDVVLPQEVDTRQNGVSSVSETVVLGDADSIQVTLEKCEIIVQPGQNVKEDSEIKEGKEVIQEVKPMQTDAPQMVEVGIPQKVEIQPSVVDTKDMVKDNYSSEFPQTKKVDEIGIKPGQDEEKVPIVWIDEVRVQKEHDLSAEPQITSENVKMEDSDSQPLEEEAVVAEETVVEYISIIRKTVVEESEEDKMAAKKSDITPEIEEIAHPSEVRPQNETWEDAEESLTETEAAEEEVWEEPQESMLRRIFSEIDLLVESGPCCQLFKMKPVEESPETQFTCTRAATEQDRMNQLLCKVLVCKNQPATLSPADVEQQLKQAKECREAAVAQVSLLSEQRRRGEVSSQASELVEDQWRSSVQDLDSVIEKKESELQLVTDYSKQLEEAETSLEELRRDLDMATESPSESCFEEAERLSSLQRTLEKRRTIFIQLIIIYRKLYIIFPKSERAAVQSNLKNLQTQWRLVEKTIEKSLYNKNAIIYETDSIKTEMNNLQGQLEDIADKLNKIKNEEWNCNEAHKLIILNAEFSAANEKYRYLKAHADEILPNSQWEKDTKEIQDGIQGIENKLGQIEEMIRSKTKMSSNPIMEKIVAVVRAAFAWAKKTEADIESRRKRVSLLPEQVHHQLRDLKKLQSEVMTNQGQLEALVEEVNELLPQLDEEEEIPMISASLKSLEVLPKSTTEKLATAIRKTESGLQTREKLSQQIADVDAWIMAYLNKEPVSISEWEKNLPDLERQARKTQETQDEAEKQGRICEALLVKSKEIAPELTITENCQLFTRLINLQDDIDDIIEMENVNKQEVEECIKMVESSKKKLVPVENSIRHMLNDVTRPKFPITNKSLQALQPLKNTLAEHKSQVECLEQWSPPEKFKEIQGYICELENKLSAMEPKATGHELYLDLRKFLEELKESVKDQIRKAKDETEGIEKYKRCQSLLMQFPALNVLCQEVKSKLLDITSDLYPSQLSAEQQRIKQTEETLRTLENSLENYLIISEGSLLKDMDLGIETKATTAFLKNVNKGLNKKTAVKLTKADTDREYQRILTLKRTVAIRLRAWEVLKLKSKTKDPGAEDVAKLKNEILQECDKQLESITEARQSLRAYIVTVKRVILLFHPIEVRLRCRFGPRGLCSERSDQIVRSLDALDQDFQSLMNKLMTCFPPNRFLSPSAVKELQEKTLSHLLVMKATVKAKGQIELEKLNSCVEQFSHYCDLRDDITQRLERAEESVNKLMTQKVTCLRHCSQQQEQLKSLCAEAESLQKALSDLREWCAEPSCRLRRETAVAMLFARVSRLRRCSKKLSSRCEQRIREWSQITDSVEKAESVLSQVEAELPSLSPLRMGTEELHDGVQSWEQYQDRLDCEHRSLSALELRVARLLGVPAHLEQAPPTPLCQQLQAMQTRYNSVSKRSGVGLASSRSELEERERRREELQRLKIWLEAADHLLSEPETGNVHEIQEALLQLFTQKALLQRITDSIQTKYSEPDGVVPSEIEVLLQDANQIMQQVEPKVNEAVEKSGPVYRLGAKLSEIQSGLHTLQKKLDQKSPTAAEAKLTQKRVWDELDVWHSCLAALDADLQDLDKPQEALVLTERLVEVQQIHSQLAKQAEQRTTLLSKTHTWLQEHQEMINSSKSWIGEAKTWLAAPATYTTAKCLSSHVHALQVVLGDSAQIRSTLQGFTLVLEEMSQVCDVSSLKLELQEADREVAQVQDSFTAPLTKLQHAAAEVEAIEGDVRKMENDVAEIKELLASPEGLPSPKVRRLKIVEQKIQAMQRTINNIQSSKPHLELPEKAEETLTVFTVVDHLQVLLQELQKKVPALFVQQPDQPREPQLEKTTSEEKEEGEIQIVHVKEDVLKVSGAKLLSVEKSTAEQRTTPTPPDTQEPEVRIAEEVLPDEPQTEEEKEAESEDAGSTPAPSAGEESPVPRSPSESSSKSGRCVMS